jgi:hypothetical protein
LSAGAVAPRRRLVAGYQFLPSGDGHSLLSNVRRQSPNRLRMGQDNFTLGFSCRRSVLAPSAGADSD